MISAGEPSRFADGTRVPTVTVLIPAYNAGPLLRPAVDSIFAQSFTDFECLIIDDGSTDGSVEALHSIDDTRLRIVSNPGNLGLVATLNRGIDLARAALLARMDADDLSMPGRLQQQVDAFRRSPSLALLGTWAEVIDVAGRHAGHIRHPIEHQEIVRTILHHNVFVHPSVMVRTQVLREMGGYSVESAYAQDYALWLRIVRRHEAANLPEVLVQYRIHPTQISQTKLREQRAAARKFVTLARREYLQDGILAPQELPPEPSLWGDLTADQGTLGNDYKRWAWRHWRIGAARDAARCAWAGLKVAPFSFALWRLLTPPQASPRYWFRLFVIRLKRKKW
jgi:hypothetical protein